MTYIVQIKPSGYLLFVEPGESILTAALRQGYDFPYNCGSGTCGTCMGKVLQGRYHYGAIEPYALNDDARSNHFALFCSAQPESDMVIEIEDVYGPEHLPARKAEYQVTDVELLKEDVYQVFLSPITKNIKYHAGQYLKVVCDDGMPIPFSIANAPNAEGKLELQIRAQLNNPYNAEIIGKITAQDTLLLRGPYGYMTYQSQPDLPLLFVAGGTGIVPLKALIEQALLSNDSRKLELFWGGRQKDDLYLSTQMHALAKQHSNFSYTPVVTNADEYWQGKQGVVHEAVLAEHSNLQDYQAYISGPTDMVYTVYDTFVEQGMKTQLIFSDTFAYAPREK